MEKKTIHSFETVPLHDWPSFYFLNVLEFNNDQKYLLDRSLKGYKKYKSKPTELSILDKTYTNCTTRGLSPLMGTFHVLMYFDPRFKRFPDEIFYNQFTQDTTGIVKPLVDIKKIDCPEDFISTLIICNFENQVLKGTVLENISSNGTGSTESLKSVFKDLDTMSEYIIL